MGELILTGDTGGGDAQGYGRQTAEWQTQLIEVVVHNILQRCWDTPGQLVLGEVKPFPDWRACTREVGIIPVN